MLERILVNFIKNGIDAGHGDCPVSVNFERVGELFYIRIRDNGPGISVEVYESITDESRHTAITTKQEGTGLGLQSAHACAKVIGADVRLASSNEEGTCFEISIPADYLNSSFYHSNIEYLVIDDSESVLESWNCFAQKNNKNILAVFPKDALSILNALPESLQWIVLDYDMKLPNGNGATLAKALKNSGIRLALSTGYKAKELPDDARAIEWDAFLSKEPMNMNDCIAPSFVNDSSEQFKINPMVSALRHDIKSKLTPLRSIYNYVKDEVGYENEKITHYVSLMGRTIDSIEGTLNQTYATEMEIPHGGET